MITPCLYNFNTFIVIMLSKCLWGVIVATNKIQTGIRFEPELLYKISYVAKDNKRSLNAQLEFLAQKCVKEFETINGEIPVSDELIYRK